MDHESALSTALSSNWVARREAAGFLASMPGEEVDAAMAVLLEDDDLAVIRGAAAALLAEGSAQALTRLAAAYVRADDQVGDTLNDELRVASALDPKLRTSLERLAQSGAAGAQLILDWLYH